MLTHEVDNAPLEGGLLDLDNALDGRLLLLRSGGTFLAQRLETLLLATVPPTVKGGAVLMIGMGSPEEWLPDMMEQVARVACREAIKLKVQSAGIAPGMLDSGLTPDRTGGATEAMLRGITQAIDDAARLAELGLSSPSLLESWTFGAGPAHLDGVTDHFRAAFRQAEAERGPSSTT
jgi:hypothetical protein